MTIFSEYVSQLPIVLTAPQYQFVHRYGRHFQTFSRDSRRMTPQQCYKNATIVSQAEGLIYVEGFAVAFDNLHIPFEHAWVCSPSGAVFDPTWEKNGIEYVGIPFRHDFVLDVLVQTGVYGMLFDPKILLGRHPSEFIHPLFY